MFPPLISKSFHQNQHNSRAKFEITTDYLTNNFILKFFDSEIRDLTKLQITRSILNITDLKCTKFISLCAFVSGWWILNRHLLDHYSSHGLLLKNTHITLAGALRG